MAFTDEQRQALKAKLRYRHVKIRANNGSSISYVEGWHAIAEANRIFGYDSWDRQTLSPRCVWRETQRGETTCFYSTKVRITVRAGESVIVREGIGTGSGRSASPEAAHEIALKAAETDATKRALATFGNPFGLALYDRDQRGVTKRPKSAPVDIEEKPQPKANLQLRHFSGRTEAFRDAATFVSAVKRAVEALPSTEAVTAFWEANLDSFSHLPRGDDDEDVVRAIGMALKGRLGALAQTSTHNTVSVSKEPRSGREGAVASAAGSITPDRTSGFLIPKEKRIRDKAHLGFVANEPCLVCGRKPTHAHHLRFAQPSALGLKVSDEYTVPLCNIHHDSLHQTGDERAWWARHGILDPLKIAGRLWTASHGAAAQPVSPDSATEACSDSGAPRAPCSLSTTGNSS